MRSPGSAMSRPEQSSTVQSAASQQGVFKAAASGCIVSPDLTLPVLDESVVQHPQKQFVCAVMQGSLRPCFQFGVDLGVVRGVAEILADCLLRCAWGLEPIEERLERAIYLKFHAVSFVKQNV